MRKLLITLLAIFLITPTGLRSQVADISDKNVDIGRGWSLGGSITIPPLMLRESVRENAKLDAVLVAGIGGGVCLVYGQKDSATGEIDRIFTFSPFTIIMSGNMGPEQGNEIDLSYAITVGFLDDLIMTGFAYNLGNNVLDLENGTKREISRWAWLLGFGVSFGR